MPRIAANTYGISSATWGVRGGEEPVTVRGFDGPRRGGPDAKDTLQTRVKAARKGTVGVMPTAPRQT